MKLPDWSYSIDAAITVCDSNGTIIYMNNKSRDTFQKYGGEQLIGSSLFGCHSPESQVIIRNLLQIGGSNTYTIEKNGIKKLIYQSAWRENGQVTGLVEISVVLPADMKHHIRD